MNIDRICTIWYFEYDESILNERMNENMEFPGATEADINWLQDCFVQSLKDKVPHFNTTNNPSLNHEHCPLLDNSLKVTIGGGGPSGSLHPWWGEGNHSVIDCHPSSNTNIIIIRNIANAMDITTAIFRYYRDTYAEHPEDRKNIEYSVLFL